MESKMISPKISRAMTEEERTEMEDAMDITDKPPSKTIAVMRKKDGDFIYLCMHDGSDKVTGYIKVEPNALVHILTSLATEVAASILEDIERMSQMMHEVIADCEFEDRDGKTDA